MVKDGWKYWEGKKVFIMSKNHRHPFQGKIITIDDHSSNQLVWITLLDKYAKRVIMVHTEIIEIKEED